MVETRGRRVLVRDDQGERVCFKGGHRAVLGDEVQWIKARGSGGKLTGIADRHTTLRRMDMGGRQQVLAANLSGLVVVTTPTDPPFYAPLLDRYLVAAHAAGLDAALCLNKVDLRVPDEVQAQLQLRIDLGYPLLRASAHTGEGVVELLSFLDERPGEPWAFVGLSGVGKTSLIARLLPELDVGPVGEISDYWGTGTHTTTRSCLFTLPGGGEIVDSPGIRGFVPAGVEVEELRRHFPGLWQVQCQYRDCLHRPGEEGCVAQQEVDASLLESYRTLLGEIRQATAPEWEKPQREINPKKAGSNTGS